ncbi:MAG: hypothetical protein C0425_00255 [Chlorobiaceae bacterium]|nr:hypothetical protein [Chlorobiaceae bacterium]MBA4308755.1 hypothetical protein [Chlorobiaceae bacterium]
MNNLDWNGIYGQASAKNILSKYLSSKKFSQAYLFTGIEGVGKDATALKFANLANNISDSYINESFIKFVTALPVGKNETLADDPITKLSKSDFENYCSEFKKLKQNFYHKISLPNATEIRINSIRALNNFLVTSITDNHIRFVIISNAHLLNTFAQNALLKSLEEPQPNTIYILTTAEPKILNETIRSRCTEIKFLPLEEDELRDILINNFDYNTSEVSSVVKLSDGSLSVALSYLKYDIINLKELTINFLRNSFANRFFTANNLSLKYSDDQYFQLLLSLISFWFRDLEKLKNGQREDLYFFDHVETLEKFLSKYPNFESVKPLEKLSEYKNLITNTNVNSKILFFNLMQSIPNFLLK